MLREFKKNEVKNFGVPKDQKMAIHQVVTTKQLETLDKKENGGEDLDMDLPDRIELFCGEGEELDRNSGGGDFGESENLSFSDETVFYNLNRILKPEISENSYLYYFRMFRSLDSDSGDLYDDV